MTDPNLHTPEEQEMTDRLLEKMLDEFEQLVADRTAISLRPSTVERQDRANRLASAARESLTTRIAHLISEGGRSMSMSDAWRAYQDQVRAADPLYREDISLGQKRPLNGR